MDELLRITYMLTDPVVMISVGDPYYQQKQFIQDIFTDITATLGAIDSENLNGGILFSPGWSVLQKVGYDQWKSPTKHSLIISLELDSYSSWFPKHCI